MNVLSIAQFVFLFWISPALANLTYQSLEPVDDGSVSIGFPSFETSNGFARISSALTSTSGLCRAFGFRNGIGIRSGEKHSGLIASIAGDGRVKLVENPKRDQRRAIDWLHCEASTSPWPRKTVAQEVTLTDALQGIHTITRPTLGNLFGSRYAISKQTRADSICTLYGFDRSVLRSSQFVATSSETVNLSFLGKFQQFSQDSEVYEKLQCHSNKKIPIQVNFEPVSVEPFIRTLGQTLPTEIAKFFSFVADDLARKSQKVSVWTTRNPPELAQWSDDEQYTLLTLVAVKPVLNALDSEWHTQEIRPLIEQQWNRMSQLGYSSAQSLRIVNSFDGQLYAVRIANHALSALTEDVEQLPDLAVLNRLRGLMGRVLALEEDTRLARIQMQAAVNLWKSERVAFERLQSKPVSFRLIDVVHGCIELLASALSQEGQP